MNKILNIEYLYNRHVARLHNDQLSNLMNIKIRKYLGVIPENVTWGGRLSCLRMVIN